MLTTKKGLSSCPVIYKNNQLILFNIRQIGGKLKDETKGKEGLLVVEKGVGSYWAEMNKASLNSTKSKAVASLAEEKPSKKQKVSLKLGTKVAAVLLPVPKASPVLAVPAKVVSPAMLPTANKARVLGDPAKIAPPTTLAAVSKATVLPATAPVPLGKLTSVTP